MSIRKDHFVFTIILIFSVNQIVAEQAESVNPEKLSPEVIAVMEGNQKTFDSVHTIQAVITQNSTYDYGEIGSRQMMEKLKIWYDGENYRQDVLESKFTGKETEPLLLGENEEGDLGYFAPPPVGDVEIVKTKSRIYYFPPTEYVGIRSIEERNKSQRIRSNIILNYQSLTGSSLKEVILNNASYGNYFSVLSERIDEDDCILLSCDFADVNMTSKIWVVPSKGYCIKKYQIILKDEVVNEYTTTLKKYPIGIWWFDTVKVEKQRQGDVIRGFEISVDSLTFNESIEPDIFTVWGIDVNPNTKIHDKIQGTTYTLAIDEEENSQTGDNSD